jgi:hypothetical protein
MIPKPRAPHDNSDEDRPPETIWAYERKRRGLELHEEIADAVPRLPETSPWHSDPCGPEPTINREEDGLFVNREEDQFDG